MNGGGQSNSAALHHFEPDESGISCLTCGTLEQNSKKHTRSAVRA